MTEYRTGNAVVRIHGTPDRDKLKEAAEQFLKRVEAQRQKGGSACGRSNAKENLKLCEHGA